jgi:hypothetical protein
LGRKGIDLGALKINTRHTRITWGDIVIDSAPPGAASFDVEKINLAYDHEERHGPDRGGGRGRKRESVLFGGTQFSILYTAKKTRRYHRHTGGLRVGVLEK